MRISIVLSIVLLAALNFAQLDNSAGDMKLAAVIKTAIARSESGDCCVARSSDEHCGMEKTTDAYGACCQSASACDKCILSTYRECS